MPWAASTLSMGRAMGARQKGFKTSGGDQFNFDGDGNRPECLCVDRAKVERRVELERTRTTEQLSLQACNEHTNSSGAFKLAIQCFQGRPFPDVGYQICACGYIFVNRHWISGNVFADHRRGRAAKSGRIRRGYFCAAFQRCRKFDFSYRSTRRWLLYSHSRIPAESRETRIAVRLRGRK